MNQADMVLQTNFNPTTLEPRGADFLAKSNIDKKLVAQRLKYNKRKDRQIMLKNSICFIIHRFFQKRYHEALFILHYHLDKTMT